MKNVIKKLLLAGLMLSTISPVVAAPLDDQAKRLYTALKANKPTEAVYTYCKKNKISAEEIANATKKICESNKDWDTYSKVNEIEVAWDERMNSMSTPAKIAVALGVAASAIGMWLLYRHLRTAPAPIIPPVVPPVVPAPAPVRQPAPAPAARTLNAVVENARANNPQVQQALQDPAIAQNIERFGQIPAINQALNGRLGVNIADVARDMLQDPEMLAALGNPAFMNPELLRQDPRMQAELNGPNREQAEALLQDPWGAMGNMLQELVNAEEQRAAQPRVAPVPVPAPIVQPAPAPAPAPRVTAAQRLFQELERDNANFQRALENPQARANIHRLLDHPQLGEYLEGGFAGMVRGGIIRAVNQADFVERIADNAYLDGMLRQYGLN